MALEESPEERAVKLILEAPIESDEDYIRLAKLIDDEVSDKEKE